MEQPLSIVLASRSPRRKEILESVGITFEVMVSGADENSSAPCPEGYVEEIAACKGEAVYRKLCSERGKSTADRILLIAADTIVVCGGEILGKPRDLADACRMLRALSGTRHEVMTGLYVRYGGKTVSTHETTRVRFAKLSEEEIEKYVATGEPIDKAGAYAIQGLSSKFVASIEGDFYNVVGLPLYRLYRVAGESFGIELY